MRKVFLLAAIATLALTSCSTISHTARTEDVNTAIYNRTSSDLIVSEQKVTYNFFPSSAQRRAGMKSMKAAAVQGLLENNGNADILVAPQFEIKKTRGLFKTKVKYIKVSGLPATYKNFHTTTQGEADIVNTLNGNATTIINLPK